jgi:hypothetical protein
MGQQPGITPAQSWNENPWCRSLDQARAIDRSVRMFAIIERVPDAILAEVKRKLAA